MGAENTKNLKDSSQRTAFEVIGVSLWKSLLRLSQGDGSSAHLMLAYLNFKSQSLPTWLAHTEVKGVFAHYDRIDHSTIHFVAKDRRRYTLLASIGILDSFLSDSLRFLFLHDSREIPSKVLDERQVGETDNDFVERIVRWSKKFSSQGKRIAFLSERFGVKIDKDICSELECLTLLRNELAHHSGFYKFNKNVQTGEIWAQPKPLPEVSQENALKAQVIVNEVCDGILVAMCRTLFGDDPRVRPLTPDVAAVHQEFRLEWAARKATPVAVEDFENTQWLVRKLDEPSALWVEDHARSFMITPTGIDVFPALFRFRRNDLHGANATASIDSGPHEDLGNSKELLEKMLTGKSVLVKFYEEPDDEPKYARFSLDGFVMAWEAACRTRAERDSG